MAVAVEEVLADVAARPSAYSTSYLQAPEHKIISTEIVELKRSTAAEFSPSWTAARRGEHSMLDMRTAGCGVPPERLNGPSLAARPFYRLDVMG